MDEPDQGSAGTILHNNSNMTGASGVDDTEIEGGIVSGSTITTLTVDAATNSMDLDLTITSHPKSSNHSYSAMSVESKLLPQASDSTPAMPPGPVSNNMQKSSGLRGSKGPSPEVTSTTRLANKITPATAIIGMQGSINQLTDIFEKSMAPGEDPAVAHREKAMQFLQEVDDGLSVGDKVAMISIFMKQAAAVNTYLSLTDTEVQQAWIHKMLDVTG
ncbi:hypothetical protein L208DRAFT_1382695 [Tricholoma matsutake]|nr:hypothetical protein L208DRAFT_1382695 [Tricholoma matsutake 945]